MSLAPVTNFPKVQVSTGYAAGAVTIILQTGHGAKLPGTFPFPLVWWDDTTYPGAPEDDPNVEIVSVTNRSGDTLTITRGQESTSDVNHNTAAKTYRMALTLTKSMWGQITTELENLSGTGFLKNATFTVTQNSPGANQLTVALKTRAGSDPSATDPVIAIFRDPTLTSGLYVIEKITSALSFTISAGSTFGFTNSLSSRLYWGLIRPSAGTVEMCAWHPLVKSSTEISLFSIDETRLISTTAEGGAGAADSAGVIYSATARASVPIRVGGYFDIQTGATAGNWSNAATVLINMGIGVKRTGDTVQTKSAITGEVATGTTTIPNDNTIPQITEGDEYMSKAIVATAAANVLEVEAEGMFAHSVGAAQFGFALFQDATANALAAMGIRIDAGGDKYPLSLRHVFVSGVAGSTTLRIRAGSETAGTTTFNGNGGARFYGGIYASCLHIKEICL